MSAPDEQDLAAVTRAVPDLRLEAREAAGRLPSPSGVALRVMRLCQDENTTLAELGRLAASDPALAARLVRAANAPACARRRPAVAVQDALMVLGMPQIRSLALGFSLIDGNRKGACEGFDYPGFWSRSLAVALAAQNLAAHGRLIAPEELFTCGLLADVGRLALASLFPEGYAELLREPDAPGLAPLAARERARFGADRNDLTRALLCDWGIPPALVGAIGARHAPEAASPDAGDRPGRIARLLAVADRLADACLASDAQAPTASAEMLEAAAGLGLNATALAEISTQTVDQWHAWSALFQLAGAEAPRPLGDEVAPDASSPAGERPVALVVDDDPLVRSMVSTIVEAGGFVVHRARDGREALRLAMQRRPRLVVTDLVMPEMDGLGLLRALRETRAGRAMYVILLTSLEHEDHLVEAFAAGADDYVSKPVMSRVLAARLRAATRVLAQQDELVRDTEELRQLAGELAVDNRKLHAAVRADGT